MSRPNGRRQNQLRPARVDEDAVFRRTQEMIEWQNGNRARHGDSLTPFSRDIKRPSSKSYGRYMWARPLMSMIEMPDVEETDEIIMGFVKWAQKRGLDGDVHTDEEMAFWIDQWER